MYSINVFFSVHLGNKFMNVVIFLFSYVSCIIAVEYLTVWLLPRKPFDKPQSGHFVSAKNMFFYSFKLQCASPMSPEL